MGLIAALHKWLHNVVQGTLFLIVMLSEVMLCVNTMSVVVSRLSKT